MPKKIVKDISASTLQVVINQLLGLTIFYITSRYLSKEVFGELNWTIAIVSTIIVFLGLGMEQIVLKRIASNENGMLASEVFLFHTIISALLFIAILVMLQMIFSTFFYKHYFIWGISFALLISYLCSPFKQIINGKEKFSHLAIVLIAANFFKAVLLIAFLLFWNLSVMQLIIIFVISGIGEYLVGMLVLHKLKFFVRPRVNKKEFFSLIHESMPQLGVIIFDSALARIDWILLGFMANTVATAEYAFAYKIFEISRLPMLVIAPVILPKFSRYFAEEFLSDKIKINLQLLFRFEIIIAFVIPIFFNLVWTPFFAALTNGKYGATNENVYLILSFSIPLHYITNFLWTLAFTQKQIRQTFFITIVTSVLNIILNLLLIPRLGTIGAAISFSVSTVVQVVLYKKLTDQTKIRLTLYPFFICFSVASLIIIVFKIYSFNIILDVVIGLVAYFALIFLFNIFNKNDIKNIRFILSK